MLAKRLLCLLFGSAWLGLVAAADEVNIQLCAKWPVQLPYEYKDDPLQVTGLRLGLIDAVSDQVKGVDIVIGLSFVMDRQEKNDGERGDVAGVQLTGAVSTIVGDMQGLQVTGFAADDWANATGVVASGLANCVAGTTKGIQLAGIVAMTGGDFFSGIAADEGDEDADTDDAEAEQSDEAADEEEQARNVNPDLGDGSLVGLQFGGVLAAVRSDLMGVSVGAMNWVRGRVKGVQLGIYSICESRVTGLQIGLINWCAELSGAQIGLINISRNHRLPVWPMLNIRF